MKHSQTDILFNTENLLIGYHDKESRPLLPPLSLSADRGEMIAVVGRNGSGKSTLLKTLAGILKPIGGRVSVAGKDIFKYDRTELALMAGYVATGGIRVPGMKVIDMVKLGRYPHTSWTGVFKEEDRRKVEFAVESTGLRNLSDRFIDELSDGERQRAMIGRVVAQDTPLMVLDEPTAFLDIKSRLEITDLLRRLSQENKRTVIFSTHDLQAVFGICGRMLLLTGDNVIDGSPEDIALKGSLNLLLDSPGLRFNPESATVVIERQVRGTVQIQGAGNAARYWTERTAQRAGYRPVCNEASLSIKVTDDNDNIKWLCRRKDEEPGLTFNSLYEVGRWLGNF